MSMSTAVLTETVVCPGCGASQPVSERHEPLTVLSCGQCQATLVVVPAHATPPPASTRSAEPQAPRRTSATPASSSGTMPRAAWITLGTLCAILYACVGLLIFGASFGIKKMPPYQAAESFAQQHPVLKQALGEPMTFGWFPTAQMHGNQRKKTGYVEFLVQGPQGSAQVALSLIEVQQQWQVVEAEYAIGDDEAQPLWVQFPGDFELRAQAEDVVSSLDEATQAQDLDGMTGAFALDAQVTVILETPPPRQVRTFHTFEAYRQDVLSDMLMNKHVEWTREESDLRLHDDRTHATGTYRWTHEVLVNDQPQTIRIDGTLTFAFQDGQATITAMELIRQVIGAAR